MYIRQHIRQPEYQKLKIEEHLRTCGKGTFKIFPLLQMQSSEIDLRRSYERNFMKKYKKKLTYRMKVRHVIDLSYDIIA